MQQDVRKVIEQQRAQLAEWFEQTAELARYIANDVCDSIEIEVDEEAEGGVLWEYMDSFVSGLQLEVINIFDDVCEKWIVHRLESLSEIMASSARENWNFDGSGIMLDGLREGYRLTEKMAVLFDSIVKKARPSIFQLLGNVVREEMSDEIPDISDEMESNGQRLQQAFKEARLQLQTEVEKAAAFVVRKAIDEYRMALLEFEAGRADH